MLNQKKVKIFLAKFHKSPAKQFLEIALINVEKSVYVLYKKMGTCLQKNGYPFRQLLKKTHYQNDIRQLLKIPRFGMILGHSLKLLRALRFFLKPFYFFFNRIARYAQSKESRNLLKKIPQITCKAIFRNCHYRTSIMYALALCVGKHFANRMICIENTALNTINSTNKLLCCFLCRFSQKTPSRGSFIVLTTLFKQLCEENSTTSGGKNKRSIKA